VGGDRTLGLAASGGEAVGHREQRHVGGVGRGGGEVAPDRAARERPLVHQEAEVQVVAREVGHVARQPLGRAQAPQRVVGQLRALAVVADEGHAAVGAQPARLRLGGVVQERREAQPAAARELVGERLGEQRGHRGRLRPAEADGGRVGLHRHDGVQHLERVAEHVGVVVRALLDAAQRLQLRQDRGEQPGLLHQLQAVAHPRRGDDALELGEHALGRDGPDRGRVLVHRPPRPGLDLEAELDGEAHGAQRAQRVVGERPAGDHPQAAGLEIGGAAVRIDQLAAGQRLGHRVDGEVARREVGVQVPVAQRQQVHVPGVAGPDGPPAAELVRELERRPAGRLRDPAGRPARVARDGEVDVVGGAAEQAVADRPADEPRGLAGQRRPSRVQRRAHAGSPSRWCSRGTRREIPQVIS
jgi:hypothetical protein